MSVAVALDFIRAVRADAALSDRLRALGADPGLEDVAALAAAAGFPCSPADLLAAHRHDWALRWLPVASRQAGAGAAEPNRASSARASAK